MTTHIPQFNRSCIRNQGHDYRKFCAEEAYNISQDHNRVDPARATSHTIGTRDAKAWKRNGG